MMLFIIIPSSATVSVPFSNSTNSTIHKAIITYYSPISNVYDLDNRDGLTFYSGTNNIRIFPNTQLYSFVDNYNNVITIKYTISKNDSLIFLTEYTKTQSVYLNGVIQKQYKDPADTKSIGTEYIFSTRKLKLFDSSQDIRNGIGFQGDMIYLQSSITPNLINANSGRFIKLTAQFAPTVINNPVEANGSNGFSLKDMQIDYSEQTITQITNSINKEYDNLNFILKFFFLIIKGFIWSFVGFPSYAITIEDYYAYQAAALAPLTLVNTLINAFIAMISFLTAMGIIFTILLIECILFIVCFLRARKGDIIETIHSWANASVSFWGTVVIRPTVWVFEKLVKIWA